MSQIKIPSAPLSVSKINSGNSTWAMRFDKNRADMVLRRVKLLPGTGPPSFDGSEYLEAFMAVRKPEDALTFVNRFGCPSLTYFDFITFSEFKDLQNMVRTAARTPLSEWPQEDLSWPPKDHPLFEQSDMTQMVVPAVLPHSGGGYGGFIGVNPWRLELRWDMTPFAFVHEATSGIEACFAQVFFELLSGVKFRWCARADCDEMFRKETGHDKIYCTPDCAHLAAVRASRARASKAKIHAKRGRKRH